MSEDSKRNNSAEIRKNLSYLNEAIIACHLCPRLVAHRQYIGIYKKAKYSDWDYWARPVPGFGDPRAKLIIVGLAPAAHGGNRTGRFFTGDPSASFLMDALYQTGFASQPTSQSRDDGMELRGAYITAAVRCVPPQDKPTSQEQHNCLPYLIAEMKILGLSGILALGHLAFKACLSALEELSTQKIKRTKFGHGNVYRVGTSLPLLFTSYHPSPRNTNTGKLKKDALVNVLNLIRRTIYQ
jgi:uracil-DNA glycosylase family 4